jgi:hypothetical protein
VLHRSHTLPQQTAASSMQPDVTKFQVYRAYKFEKSDLAQNNHSAAFHMLWSVALLLIGTQTLA